MKIHSRAGMGGGGAAHQGRNSAGGIGRIPATGLEKRDGVWINPDRINAPVTVHLDVKAGVGEIRLVR